MDRRFVSEEIRNVLQKEPKMSVFPPDYRGSDG
jgi:hypothetical protein